VPKNPTSYGPLIDEREPNEFSPYTQAACYVRIAYRRIRLENLITMFCKSKQTKKGRGLFVISATRGESRASRAGSSLIASATRVRDIFGEGNSVGSDY